MSVKIEDLKAFCRDALARVGMSPLDAETTSDALVTTDAMGVFTHGTKLLAGYIRKIKAGGYSATAQPTIDRQGPGWAIVDGQTALGQVGCVFAVRKAIEKAKNTGIGYVGLRNTSHIGAAGYYALLAAREGLIAMVTGNDIPSVAAPGSRKSVLGSNPLSYAVPVGDGDPILLDIATAAVAGGKVYAALQRGETIPTTWLIGPDGKPTTDGNLYPHQTALAPMAGHKGYGLGLWCEILSAVLPGGNITWQVVSWMHDPLPLPTRHNASFIVIDIGAMIPPEQFEAKIRHLVDEIHAVPTAEGVDRVLLPGEREGASLRKSQLNGIELPSDVLAKLQEVAEETSLPFPFALPSTN